MATSQSILTQQITTLRSQQEQILATQAQHTAILRQIQHRLGITSAPDHAIPSPPEPSQAFPFVDQPMPHEEPPTGEAAEPSFPQQTPCHSGGTTSSLFFNRFYHIEDNVQLGWGES